MRFCFNLTYRFFFFALIFYTTLLQAQFDFENLNFVPIREGIPKKAISAFVQDDEGFIWIGTQGSGLFRYDGTNYVAFRHIWDDSTTISSNQVNALYIDKKRRLWVGTDNGLNLFNNEAKTFRRFDKLEGIRPEGDYFQVRTFLEDSKDNLLIGTYGSGLLKMNLVDYSISKVKIAPNITNESFFFNAMEKGTNGKIYMGTSNGLMLYDENNEVLNRYTSNQIPSEDLQKARNNIESLLIDKNNNLWIGTWTNGLLKLSFEPGAEKLESFPITSKKIFCFLKVQDKILLGTENDGLFVMDNQGKMVHRYTKSLANRKNIKSNSIWSLYLDEEERIWLGYNNKGVDVYDPLYDKFGFTEIDTDESDSKQSSIITGIQRSKSGRLLISTLNTIGIYDPVLKTYEHIADDVLKADIEIESSFIDSHQNIWIGTWADGVYFLEHSTKRFVNYTKENTNEALKTNTIRGFTEDKNGRIWMASHLKGLHYYDSKKRSFHHCDTEAFVSSDLINADTRTLLIDSEEILWAGTSGGLFKITDLGDDTFEVENLRIKMQEARKNHPSLHHILSLHETEDATIWIGTEGAGLFRYERGEDAFYNQNLFQDIAETSVNGIIEDDQNNLWICGSSGITKFSILNNSITNYTEDDGLLTHYFYNGTITKDQSGVLYFGSYLGINHIDPTRIQTNKLEPKLHFTDFKLFNKSVVPGSKFAPLEKNISETNKIKLKYDQNVFSIEYVGINYTRAEKNEYAYLLEGFDNDWNFVGDSKSATYTNLEPGDYLFKVKASNNDGIWSQNPLQLKIKVQPPWWKTEIAYTLYALLAIASVVGISLFSRKRFREKQMVLFERDKRLQEEELHQAKLRFFTNISHEFRTPLTLIINPATDLVKNKKLHLPKVASNKLKVIHKNANRLSRLIEELMDFRKLQLNKVQVRPEEINIVQTLQDIMDYFIEESKKRQISLKFNTMLDELRAWVDPNMFEKIIFNILSNSFKVTPDDGKIVVGLRMKLSNKSINEGQNQNFRHFEVSIEDTGPGIDQKEYKRIFKRFYQVASLNKSYYGSTGIGLEMVKGYMNLHHGDIIVESELQKGAKFIMTFPMVNSDFYETEKIVSETKINKTPEPYNISDSETTKIDSISEHDSSKTQKEHTVLIVEDNLELQDYVREELETRYHILVAPNGKIGFDLAMEKQPELIITDVVMPVMNGLELCSKIKNNLATSHIPLLMLTAKAMVEDRINGIDTGADGYLSKPFHMKLLKTTVKQLITSRRMLFDKYHQEGEIETTSALTSLDDQFIKRVLYLINVNIADPNLNVEHLAGQLRLSRSQLYRKIKTLTGLSANEFLRKIRLEKGKELLQSKENYNVSEVTYKVGFSSPSYFTKCFKKEFGYLPTEEEIKLRDTPS